MSGESENDKQNKSACIKLIYFYKFFETPEMHLDNKLWANETGVEVIDSATLVHTHMSCTRVTCRDKTSTSSSRLNSRVGVYLRRACDRCETAQTLEADNMHWNTTLSECQRMPCIRILRVILYACHM